VFAYSENESFSRLFLGVVIRKGDTDSGHGCLSRRESRVGVRLRNGLLGLLATVAIVATAAVWQGGEERGPLSLLSIELGRHGAPDVVESPYDVKNGITATVQGPSVVRNKLISTLRPMEEFRRFAGPSTPRALQNQQVFCFHCCIILAPYYAPQDSPYLL